MATMTVRQGGAEIAVLHPENGSIRQAMPTTEADIKNGFLRDIYLVIGDPQDGVAAAGAQLCQTLGQLDLGRRDPDGAGRR